MARRALLFRAAAAAATATVLLARAAPAAPEPPGRQPAGLAEPPRTASARSTSVSRQFVVHSPDRAFRQELASRAEEIKSLVLQTLRLRDAWQLPVVILAQDPPAGVSGPPPQGGLRLVDAEGALRIHLVIERRAGASAAAFDRDVARAVLLEIACRDAAPRGGAQAVALPGGWLVDGTLALAEMRRTEVPAYLFDALLRAGQTDPVRFLRAAPASADSTSVGLQRAVGAALVQALLDRPEAGRGIVAALRAGVDAPGSDPLDHLFAGFPSLERSPAVLAKAWAVQVGRFASQKETAALGVEATRAAIAEALAFEAPAAVGATGGAGPATRPGIADFELLADGDRRRDYARRARATLDSLAMRAHPLWSDVIEGYAAALADLERGRTKGLAARIEGLAAMDRARGGAADAIDDYLNWLEASAPGSGTGAFDGYLRAAAAQQAAPPTRSNDRIAGYLDSLEREFR